MSTQRMNMALYRLLKRTSNVTEDEAQEAASLDDELLNKIDSLEKRVNSIEKDVHLMKWMVATNVALTIAIFLRLVLM